MTTKQFRNPPFKGTISSDPPQFDNIPYKLTLQQSTPIKRANTKEFSKTNIYAQNTAAARNSKAQNVSQNDFSKLSKKNTIAAPNSIYTIVNTPKQNQPNRSSLNVDTSNNQTTRTSIPAFFSPRAGGTFGLPEQDFENTMPFADEASQDSQSENKQHEATRILEKIREISEYISKLTPKTTEVDQNTTERRSVSQDGLQTRFLELNQLLRRKYQLWEDPEILDKISEVGDTEVLRVINKFTKKVYVKKITRLQTGAELDEKVLAELQALLKLQESSGLLRIIFIEYIPGKRYSQVLEYGKGLLNDLGTFMRERQIEWDEKLLLEIFFQLHEQVLALRALKIHHLDINPKNIIITENYLFKLRNFTTAIQNIEPGDQELELVGTEGYMAPEILENLAKGLKTGVYDPYKADVYSISMTVLSLALNKNALGIEVSSDLKDLSRMYPKLTELISFAIFERTIPVRDSKELSKKDLPVKLVKKFNTYIIDKIYEKIRLSPSIAGQKYSILHLLDDIELWLTGKLEESANNPNIDSVEKGRFSMIHGCILESRGSLDEAKQKYLEILSLNPDPSTSVSNYESAEAYIKIAEIFFLQEKLSESAMCYLKSLNIYKNLLPELHPELARLSFKLGKVYAIQKNFEGAMKFFMSNIAGYNDKNFFIPYLPNAHENISWLHAKQNNFSEAISYFKKGIEIRILLYGDHHAELIKCYENLSEIYLKSDDFSSALEYQNKSLEVIKHLNSENIGLIGRRYGSIGRFCLRAKQYEEALTYLETGLRTLKEDPEELQAELANFYRRIALANFKLKRFKAALESYGNSCQIRITLQGENASDLSEDYNNMGLIYMESNKYTEALVYYLRCIQVKSNSQHDNIDLSTYFYNLGICFYHVRKYEEASDSLKRSIGFMNKIEKNEFDPLPDAWSGDAYFYFGSALRYLKKYKDAIENLNKSLEIRLAGNKSDQLVGAVYEELAAVYEAQHNSEESFKYFEKAAEITLKYNPNDFSRLLKNYNDLGLACFMRNDYNKAIEYLHKCVNICQEHMSDQPFQLGILHKNLAFAHFDAGDDQNARLQAQKAREIFLNMLPEDHPYLKDLNEIIPLRISSSTTILAKIPELPESPDHKQNRDSDSPPSSESKSKPEPLAIKESQSTETSELQSTIEEKASQDSKPHTETKPLINLQVSTIEANDFQPQSNLSGTKSPKDEKIEKIFQRYMSQLDPEEQAKLQRSNTAKEELTPDNKERDDIRQDIEANSSSKASE